MCCAVSEQLVSTAETPSAGARVPVFTNMSEPMKAASC